MLSRLLINVYLLSLLNDFKTSLISSLSLIFFSPLEFNLLKTHFSRSNLWSYPFSRPHWAGPS